MATVQADLTGYFVTDLHGEPQPAKGRILLGNDQIVLVDEDGDKQTVSTHAILDINVCYQPEGVPDLPGTGITVALEDGVDRPVLVVAGTEDEIQAFGTELYGAVLSGSTAQVKHPASVGGRVTDESFEAATLHVRPNGIVFDTESDTVRIGMNSVIDFDQDSREIGGSTYPVIEVSHMNDGVDQDTLAAMTSGRELTLLGRFLRRTYQNRLQRLKECSLSDIETELLVTLYSVGDMDVSLPSVLDADPTTVKRAIKSVAQKGLIEPGEHNPRLTALGQIVVNLYLERINE